MKKTLFSLFILSISITCFTQGTTVLSQQSGSVKNAFVSGTASAPAASAIIECRSTNRGFLLPRMTNTQRNSIASPATGLQVYNTTTNRVNYYNGTAWFAIDTGITNTAWNLTGNAGTNPATNFIGTIDAKSVVFKTNNTDAWSIDTLGNLLPASNNAEKIGSPSLAINTIYAGKIISDLFKFKDTDDNTILTIENATDLITFDVDTPKFNVPLLITDGTQGAGKVFISDANGLASWQGLGGASGSDIPAYPDNATAVAILGTGKLYYTNVAGEYILKVTH